MSQNHQKVFYVGFIFKKPPFDQAKLVRCIKGKVSDVVVDLRKRSQTYGQYIVVELSCENKNNFLFLEVLHMAF